MESLPLNQADLQKREVNWRIPPIPSKGLPFYSIDDDKNCPQSVVRKFNERIAYSQGLMTPSSTISDPVRGNGLISMTASDPLSTVDSFNNFVVETDELTDSINRSISNRERLLQELKSSVDSFIDNYQISEIVELIKALRLETLDIIESIHNWRSRHTSHRPFIFNGSNYLLKVISDLDFLDNYDPIIAKFCFEFSGNPLAFRDGGIETSITQSYSDKLWSSQNSTIFFEALIDGIELKRLKEAEKLLKEELIVSRSLANTDDGNGKSSHTGMRESYVYKDGMSFDQLGSSSSHDEDFIEVSSKSKQVKNALKLLNKRRGKMTRIALIKDDLEEMAAMKSHIEDQLEMWGKKLNDLNRRRQAITTKQKLPRIEVGVIDLEIVSVKENMKELNRQHYHLLLEINRKRLIIRQVEEEIQSEKVRKNLKKQFKKAVKEKGVDEAMRLISQSTTDLCDKPLSLQPRNTLTPKTMNSLVASVQKRKKGELPPLTLTSPKANQAKFSSFTVPTQTLKKCKRLPAILEPLNETKTSGDGNDDRLKPSENKSIGKIDDESNTNKLPTGNIQEDLSMNMHLVDFDLSNDLSSNLQSPSKRYKEYEIKHLLSEGSATAEWDQIFGVGISYRIERSKAITNNVESAHECSRIRSHTNLDPFVAVDNESRVLDRMSQQPELIKKHTSKGENVGITDHDITAVELNELVIDDNDSKVSVVSPISPKSDFLFLLSPSPVDKNISIFQNELKVMSGAVEEVPVINEFDDPKMHKDTSQISSQGNQLTADGHMLTDISDGDVQPDESKDSLFKVKTALQTLTIQEVPLTELVNRPFNEVINSPLKLFNKDYLAAERADDVDSTAMVNIVNANIDCPVTEETAIIDHIDDSDPHSEINSSLSPSTVHPENGSQQGDAIAFLEHERSNTDIKIEMKTRVETIETNNLANSTVKLSTGVPNYPPLNTSNDGSFKTSIPSTLSFNHWGNDGPISEMSDDSFKLPIFSPPIAIIGSPDPYLEPPVLQQSLSSIFDRNMLSSAIQSDDVSISTTSSNDESNPTSFKLSNSWSSASFATKQLLESLNNSSRNNMYPGATTVSGSRKSRGHDSNTGQSMGRQRRSSVDLTAMVTHQIIDDGLDNEVSSNVNVIGSSYHNKRRVSTNSVLSSLGSIEEAINSRNISREASFDTKSSLKTSDMPSEPSNDLNRQISLHIPLTQPDSHTDDD